LHGVTVPRVSAPAQRTVGQLVSDAVRLYGDRFWRALLLGVPPAILFTALLSRRDYAVWLVLMATFGGLLLSLSYVGGCLLAADLRFDRRALLAVALGVLIFAPFPFLLYVFVLPAIAWLALVGLTIPVLLVERLPVRQALSRGLTLARADFVHALGGLATLFIVWFLTVGVLMLLLRQAGEQPVRIAGFLALTLVSPVLFLGGALLYFDQVARHDERRGREVPRR
jgi:hypothetical protein